MEFLLREARSEIGPRKLKSSRLSLNQITVKGAPLDRVLGLSVEAGIESVGLWREPVNELGIKQAAKALAASGLRFSSLCRGGFFTSRTPEHRRKALEENRRAIDETAELAANSAAGSVAVLVLVVGGIPEGSRDLLAARENVSAALEELVPYSRAAGVSLAIEALHPMYLADRAVVSTLEQALELASPFTSSEVGVVIDSFHTWWDPNLEKSIARAGREKRILSFQVCDWMHPLPADNLLGRTFPGEGLIDFSVITKAVYEAGYNGDIEVEIFNSEIWSTSSSEVIAKTIDSYKNVVEPYLA
jgi:sugar phosphate isomerase/epimerase